MILILRLTLPMAEDGCCLFVHHTQTQPHWAEDDHVFVNVSFQSEETFPRSPPEDLLSQLMGHNGPQLSPKQSMGKRSRTTEVGLDGLGFAPVAGLGLGSTSPDSCEGEIDSKPNLELCRQGSRWMECCLTTDSRILERSWRPTWYSFTSWKLSYLSAGG